MIWSEKSQKMTKKSRKFVPAPLPVEVEPSAGSGHGSKWNEEQRWQTILKWKDEKKWARRIANELGVSRSSVQDLIHNLNKLQSITLQDRVESESFPLLD